MPGEYCELLARHRVITRYGNKSISLYLGDILDMPCDQWVFSAFQGDYQPKGSSPWVSVWERFVNKPKNSYHPKFYGEPNRVIGNDVVFSLPTEAIFNQDYPIIVLHLLGNEYWSQFDNNNLVLKRSYSDLLLSLKILSESGELGSVIGMPLLGSKFHGYSIEEALDAQKTFAEDALQTVPGLNEVIICAYSDKDAESVMKAYHNLMNDHSTILRNEVENWIIESMENMYDKINHQSDKSLGDDVVKGIRDLISMSKREKININDIAIQARSVLETWLNKSKLLSAKHTMERKIEQIVGETGRPNRSGSYLHSIRILGNTASHRLEAPYQLSPEDLVTIFMAVLGMLQLNQDMQHNRP